MLDFFRITEAAQNAVIEQGTDRSRFTGAEFVQIAFQCTFQ